MTEQAMTDSAAPSDGRSVPGSRRWLALAVLCLGVLMIMLDTTIVTIALPYIKADLHFDDAALAWVVNAYFLFFGGFLLLGGRLGDLYGPRRLFLIGTAVFAAASFACGIAPSAAFLVAARAVQGIGGAIVTAVALPLLLGLFSDGGERAKAMAIYGFVCAGGSTIGALLGGVLTGSAGWPWIFLVNVPVGIAVAVLSFRVLPPDARPTAAVHLDLLGAATGTAGLLFAVYAIVNGNGWGWTSRPVLGCAVVAVFLLAAFVVTERRVANPLMPLGVFRNRNVVLTNGIITLWAAALFAWFFLSSLSLHRVGGYETMAIGLAILPANVAMALLSLGVSGWLIGRFGLRRPLMGGLALASTGLFWLSGTPMAGDFTTDILPGMVLFGAGAGIAVNPMLLAAMDGVPEGQTGLVSGVLNTSFAMGGALLLALLSSYAAYTAKAAESVGAAPLPALSNGYQAAFFAAGCCALLGAALSTALKPSRQA